MYSSARGLGEILGPLNKHNTKTANLFVWAGVSPFCCGCSLGRSLSAGGRSTAEQISISPPSSWIDHLFIQIGNPQLLLTLQLFNINYALENRRDPKKVPFRMIITSSCHLLNDLRRDILEQILVQLWQWITTEVDGRSCNFHIIGFPSDIIFLQGNTNGKLGNSAAFQVDSTSQSTFLYGRCRRQ